MHLGKKLHKHNEYMRHQQYHENALEVLKHHKHTHVLPELVNAPHIRDRRGSQMELDRPERGLRIMEYYEKPKSFSPLPYHEERHHHDFGGRHHSIHDVIHQHR